MIYSNDNNDKAQRQRNYILTVYILPLLVAAISSISIYYTVGYFQLDKTDRTCGIGIGIVIGIIIWFRNKHKWLPLLNGDHYRIPDKETPEPPITRKNISEPTSYVAEFRYSRSDKAIIFTMGVITFVFGVYRITKTSVILPLLVCAAGLFLVNIGYKGFIDTSPKLKLSEKGLWTKELGFQPWSSIRKAIVENEGSETHLNIYLLNGKFEDPDFPDQKLSLADIKDRDKISGLILELKK